MASNRNDDRSLESSQEQNKKYLGINRQESIPSQEQRAQTECSKILQYVTGNPKGDPLYIGDKPTKKRIARLYYVNQGKTILIILQGDITRTKVDAIVNAANEHMTGGAGVDGIIHSAAGDELYEACKAHKQIYRGVRLPTGRSRILLSYNMSKTTHYIINTAGPIYNNYRAKKCKEDLTSCYKTALALADLYDLESVAFTAISCGIFGYPANDGADVALRTVDDCADNLPVVVFVLWENHIYDAWIKKAEELNFPIYDPYSPEPVSSPQPSNNNNNNNNQETVSTNSTTIGNDKKLSNDNTLKENDTEKLSESETVDPNPIVIDNDKTLSNDNTSKKNETETLSESETGDSKRRKQSDSVEQSDTQKTENLDEEDNRMEDTSPLTTNQTEGMGNLHLGKGSRSNDEPPRPQEATEESNKSDDEKELSHGNKDESQPTVVENPNENKQD